MLVKEWTTTADFADGTLVGVVAINNELRLAEPNSSGYAEYIFDTEA